MQRALLVAGIVVVCCSSLACGRKGTARTTPTSEKAEAREDVTATSEAKPEPVAKWRALDKSAVKELDAAWDANPVTFDKAYRGVRWRFRGTVWEIDALGCGITNNDGCQGQMTFKDTRDIERLVNGKTFDVEVEILSWDRSHIGTFYKRCVIVAGPLN